MISGRDNISVRLIVRHSIIPADTALANRSADG